MQDLLMDRVAVVTGSGRGIGEAIVKKLSAWSAKIVVTDVLEDEMLRVVEEINRAGGTAASYRLDVTQYESMREHVENIHKIFGRIDIWVNNAGITAVAPVEEITPAHWDRLIELDCKSVFFCTQAVFDVMKKQQYGKLVHISSMAGERGGRSSSAAYSTAKAGVLNLNKCFALAGGPYNITSNAVCPGRTLTKMAEGLSWNTDPKDDPKLTIPLGRFGQPEDIANAVLFLASNLSDYITGEAIDVNGGLFMR
ncbi:MAG: 3-oxoacyl-(acyl-carrier-protein) reductase FabG [Firmicutes bacterium ADurb.Bin182]|nr:MAG: 3-oxoacyl-(acyl-carrier-protein) reductase FabG [Firmicutes bacterium ADurb.Bin182]